MKLTANDVSSNSNFLVLNSIRHNYPISRNEINEITKLSIPSVSRIASTLIEKGYIKEVDAGSLGVGRKTKLLDINETAVLTVGMEYDATTLKAAIINAKGQIHHCNDTDTTFVSTLKISNITPEELIKIISSQIRKLTNHKSLEPHNIFGVGVALPGIIDNEQGIVRFSANLSWGKNVPFADMLRAETKTHCVIDNDIKSAAYAEHNRRDFDSKITALLYVDEGIGSAVIVNGVVLRGITNSAGEVGHVTHDAQGMLCSCGKVGCYQTKLINSFLISEARKFSDINRVYEIFLPQIRKNVWAQRIIENYVSNFAGLIDNIVGAYDPDTVILLGDLINDIPSLFEDICNKYRSTFAGDYLQYELAIEKSMYNGYSPLIGIGVQASEKFFSDAAQGL
ncbi:MAG: ROK family transcriptional regulator [Oscillospiraceae bacterium]|nr:ROK family transcriptional regulator [Oscillospiraceae bacterium]